VLLAIVALGVPLAVNLRDRVQAEVRSEARGQADLVAATAADLLAPGDRDALASVVRRAAASVRGRVVVTDRRGRVLFDSAGQAAGDDFANRPEIRAALAGRADQRERESATLGARLLATAVPIVRRGRPAGAVRITQSTAAVRRSVRDSLGSLALLLGLVLALGVLAALVIGGAIARPLRRLEGAAGRVAEGDLEARAAVEGTTEQRSLARSFNDMTARLAALLRNQQEFVADASHSLRTPLAGVRLRIEEARAAGVSDAADAELEAGMREVDRLAQMVDELLVLSRAGERDLPPERVDLADAAQRAAARWAGRAREREIALAAEAPQGAGAAWAPRAELDRALDPLVENALAYAPAGSTVRIVATADAIEVLDEGPGLVAGEEEAVLERFHRGRAGGQVPGGSGLGLAIARELTARWEGSAGIANRPQGGARAWVRWPAP
jgi:signal transduction histidine kinase